MSEQSKQGAQSACPHPEAVGKRWSDHVSPERQAELKALADQQRVWAAAPDRQGRESYFQDVPLTGADVFWLAAYALAGPEGDLATTQERLRHILSGGGYNDLSALHLEGASLTEAHLERANLERAHLERAVFFGGAYAERASSGEALVEPGLYGGAHLEQANFYAAHLEGADLRATHLEGAFVHVAHLERANLREAHLKGTSLREAHLEGADLRWAHLERADFYAAHLEGANLAEAHLEGASLSYARLEGANLHRATFDERSELGGITLDDTPSLAGRVLALLLRRKVWGPAALGDVRWHDVDLTPVGRWPRTRLGDERGVGIVDLGGGRHRGAARAYRQVAQRLRDQGMADEADRFSYRAQVMQRAVALRQGNVLRWLFSWVLFLLAGYGYRPLRSLFWYLVVIAGFAAAYFRVTHSLPVLSLPPSQLGKTFDWTEAFVLSFSAFHGRGFFNAPGNLGDPVAILATAEAVFGLFIEISFIATFTQRFFGSK